MKFENTDVYTYFRRKDNTFYYNYTKEEINNMIDKDGRDAFIYFCKELDIPFIEREYQILKERYPESKIFGRYLSKMKLTSFRPFVWNDSNMLNERMSK